VSKERRLLSNTAVSYVWCILNEKKLKQVLIIRHLGGNISSCLFYFKKIEK
jgi:hypothetical protein